jgi:hypothetical protein
MRTDRNDLRRRQRGFALAAVLLMLLLLMGISASIHSSVVSDTVSSGAHHRATSGFYAAEAGINHGMGDYRNIFLSYGTPAGADYDPHTFTMGPRNVTYQLADVPGNPRQVIVPGGHPFAGLNATEYRYTATSISSIQTGDVEASIGTQFNVDYVPLFQFLAFYQNDLEILPGANMNLHGPVHTNGSLYLNSDATLTVNELNPNIPTVHLSAAGNVYRGRKDASTCAGTVRIAKLKDANNDGALDIVNVGCGSGTSALNSATLSTWLGALLAHQPSVSVPSPDALVHGSGEFWLKADVRIALDLKHPDGAGRFPLVVQTAAGNTDAAATAKLQSFVNAKPGRLFYNDVPTGSPSVTTCTTTGSYCNRTGYAPNIADNPHVYACAGSDLGLYPGCAAYIANETRSDGSVTARRGGFYNNREARWVYMLNLNLHDLLAWNRAQSAGNRLFDPDDVTEGGVVVFLTVDGVGSPGIPTPRYGVRVFGSPNLDFPAAADPTGVTVASDQALYVEGNYNTGGGACSSFASCPKAPAALMADTLNVLSNAWSGSAIAKNDYQSFQPLASRPSADTTIYSALLAGVDTTLTGTYNGGLENYPRFHESWSGTTLFYRGSFVSLGTPRHSSGVWCGTGAGCNIYNAPQRNWDYDTDFQNVANLPPLTPRFVAVDQILFTENFR